jgi:hypothetical protein
MIILVVNQLHDLIVDDAGVGIVDSSVTANQQLRVLFLSGVERFLVEENAEFSIGVDDIGNT